MWTVSFIQSYNDPWLSIYYAPSSTVLWALLHHQREEKQSQIPPSTHPTQLPSSFCTFRPVTPGNQVSSENVSNLLHGSVTKPLRTIATDSALFSLRGSSVQWLDTLCSRWHAHLSAVPLTSWVSYLTPLYLSLFFFEMGIIIVSLHRVDVRSKEINIC